MQRKEAFPGAAGGEPGCGSINETPDSEQVEFSVLHMRMRSRHKSQECQSVERLKGCN